MPGFFSAEAQETRNLRLRSEGRSTLNQALSARREGKLTDAFRLFEEAVTSDPRMLFYPDEGLAMELLGDYRRRVEQSPLSTELFGQMERIEGLILGSREEGIKRNLRFLQNNPDPKMRPVAEAEIARFDRELKTLQAERTRREELNRKTQVIYGTGKRFPFYTDVEAGRFRPDGEVFKAPSPEGISTTPDPENVMQPRDEENAARYYELERLRERMTALQREKMAAEQNFYDSFRRSSRVQNSPGRGPVPRDPGMENLLQNQTRLSQTDVFEIRRKINEIQNRIETIERELQGR